MKSDQVSTPDEFIHWAMLTKWVVSTASRREITKKVEELFSRGLISEKQLNTYLNLTKRDLPSAMGPS